MSADEALPVWDALFEVGERYGIYPVGINAMDVARVEAGLILIEAEYTSARHAVAVEQQYSPYELGFEPLVDLGKATDFTGRRALRAEHAAGGPSPAARRRRARLARHRGHVREARPRPRDQPLRTPRPGAGLQGGKQVGRATSVTWGTTIKKMVGFGSVDKGHASPAHASASSGASRASAARSPRPSCRCPSSTWIASALGRSFRRNGNAIRASCSARQPSGNMESPMDRRSDTRALIVFATLAGLVGLVVGIAGSWVLGVIVGLITLGMGLAITVLGPGRGAEPRRTPAAQPARRRRPRRARLGGRRSLDRLGGAQARASRPAPIQEAMATDLGSEYMELVRRTFIPRRSGDLQLLLAPYNSSNYPQESLSLVPQDPRTSHASVWMYLERIPLLVHAPGLVAASDSDARVTLADLAPTTAQLIGFDGWPDDRDGSPLPLSATRIDEAAPGRRDVRDRRRRLERPRGLPGRLAGSPGADGRERELPQRDRGFVPRGDGLRTRHDRHGRLPEPSRHHRAQPRDEQGVVRKAYDTPGEANPGDIWIPTLADLWHEETGAWVGRDRLPGLAPRHDGVRWTRPPADDLPVGVFWDEDGTATWQPHNPELFRLPRRCPSPDDYQRYLDEFDDPGWDSDFTPVGRQSPCCRPPIVRYPGDVIEAGLRLRADRGRRDEPALHDLQVAGLHGPRLRHGLESRGSTRARWTGLQLRAVDEELGRGSMLDERFPDEYALIVTADHGQCPLPDSVGGVRLDPIQLERFIESRFSGVTGVGRERRCPRRPS